MEAASYVTLGLFAVLAVTAGAKLAYRRARGRRTPPFDPELRSSIESATGLHAGRRLKPSDYVPRDRLGSEDFE